jgi:phasin
MKRRAKRNAVKHKGWKMPKFVKSDTVENVEFPSFDASKATDQVRAFAEKGLEQSKEVYAKVKTGAEEAQKALESTFETAKSVGSDLSLKTIAALRTNTEVGFSHLEALVGAKSLSEVIELQTAFIRKSVETAVEQAKELQTVTTKAAEDVSKPLKAVFEKAVKELKVA